MSGKISVGSEQLVTEIYCQKASDFDPLEILDGMREVLKGGFDILFVTEK